MLFLMMRQNGSHKLADVFEPKTWLVNKKYSLLTKKPKAPVKSAAILGKRKQAEMSAKTR